MTHTFDRDESHRLDAADLTPDIAAQRATTLTALSPAPGERVVDVGCGPGLLTAEIAHAVGPTGHVTGLDVSEAMLTVARQRCQPVADRTTLVHGDATALPLLTASFDAAVTTQVLEYVPDIQTALAELHRVVRPGGRVVILDTDWDSIVWHTTNPDRMRTILAAWTRRFADPHLPRTLAPRLKAAGFEVTGPDVLVIVNTEHDPNTYSLANAEIMATFARNHGGDLRGSGSPKIRAAASALVAADLPLRPEDRTGARSAPRSDIQRAIPVQ